MEKGTLGPGTYGYDPAAYVESPEDSLRRARNALSDARNELTKAVTYQFGGSYQSAQRSMDTVQALLGLCSTLIASAVAELTAGEEG